MRSQNINEYEYYNDENATPCRKYTQDSNSTSDSFSQILRNNPQILNADIPFKKVEI